LYACAQNPRKLFRGPGEALNRLRYTPPTLRLPPTPRPPRLSRAGVIAVFYGALAGIAVIWGATRGHADIYRMPGVPLDVRRVATNLAAGVAFGLVFVAITRYMAHRHQWARDIHQEFRHLLGPLAARETVILALASSIGEESFFRGALVPHVGVIASSVLFGLLHIGPGPRFVRFLPWTLASFLVGLALGALMREGGDLSGPIAAHFTINYLNLRYIAEKDLG